MAIVIDDIIVNNFDFDNFIITVNATSDDPPIEYSLNNIDFQISNTFIVPNNVQSTWTVYARDNALNETAKQEFTRSCVINVNENNFIRWSGYTNLIIDNGQIIGVECPNENDIPSDPPYNNLEVITLFQHCIVIKP